MSRNVFISSLHISSSKLLCHQPDLGQFVIALSTIQSFLIYGQTNWIDVDIAHVHFYLAIVDMCCTLCFKDTGISANINESPTAAINLTHLLIWHDSVLAHRLWK